MEVGSWGPMWMKRRVTNIMKVCKLMQKEGDIGCKSQWSWNNWTLWLKQTDTDGRWLLPVDEMSDRKESVGSPSLRCRALLWFEPGHNNRRFSPKMSPDNPHAHQDKTHFHSFSFSVLSPIWFSETKCKQSLGNLFVHLFQVVPCISVLTIADRNIYILWENRKVWIFTPKNLFPC